MENFLDSSILPGDALPKHAHKKLFVILIIIVVVAIAILASLLWYSKNGDLVIPAITGQRGADPAVQDLKKYEVTISDKQALQDSKDLKKYEVRTTVAEDRAALDEILKYSSKK